MGGAKQKSAFRHAQNLIQIILRMRKISWILLSIHTFCSIQWFCLRRVKALIRLRTCAVWSGPSLSAVPESTFAHGATRIISANNHENKTFSNIFMDIYLWLRVCICTCTVSDIFCTCFSHIVSSNMPKITSARSDQILLWAAKEALDLWLSKERPAKTPVKLHGRSGWSFR